MLTLPNNDPYSAITAETRHQTILGLRDRLAASHPDLGQHVGRVARLCDQVGSKMGFPDEEREDLLGAALLHDIGKLSIPRCTLDKPGALNEAEWKVMRGHPIVGDWILQAAGLGSGITGFVRSSHERVDGSGYPDGLAREAIPLGARVIAVCDAYDAMTSSRPYRPVPMTSDAALLELERSAGTQFDPVVVDAITHHLADESKEKEHMNRASKSPVNRSNSGGKRSVKALLLAALAAGLLITGFGPASAVAAPTSMVDLGQASTYAVLSGASVGNTVSAAGAPHTTIRGDLGVKASTQPTGFPPGIVTGTTRVGNTADQAHADLVAAYTEVAARTGGAPLAGALAGITLSPGLHTIAAAASNTGTVTLNGGGNPNAVFVIQVNGALAFAAGSHVVLTNGAKASRVFWQVNGAGAVGASADFAGTLMAMDAVAMGSGTLVNGRAFARNGALTLDNNQFYSAPPVVAINGGDVAHTTDTTPAISGTTDVEAPGIVTVTIAGQTLTATPTDGEWSVTSAILANGNYPVAVSVADAAGNPGGATQQLTVDTVPPVVVLDGGASQTTNDPTPTISGTSDVAVDTVVRVTVDSQSLRALVHSGGTWNIRPIALADGTHTVTASVTDPAGNESTDTQTLTVDTAGPAVTIAGGANALTNDATPEISGTADVLPGSTVTVTLADETLTGLVGADGAWSVTAAALSDGPHRVVISVSDAAGNPATFTQTLTVDTVDPVVTITGGPSATTPDLTPTVAGTSTATPGTIVTMSIAGQTMTTLVQTDGDWNATPTAVGEGTWQVVASAADPAGNVGAASQTLTIAAAPAIDTNPPETTITKSPPNRTTARRVTYAFISSEAGSRFRCTIDKRSFKSCASPKSLRVGRGIHTFRVRAIDPAGNLDPTPAKDQFRVK